MSSSLPLSKIDFDDSDKDIRNKIRKAYSVDGDIDNNGLLAILRYIISRKFEQKGEPMVIPRKEEHGGPMSFTNYQEIEEAFVKKELYSGDLKTFLVRLLCFCPTFLNDLTSSGD